MKKISSIQTFNEQLQKLNHLMEQEKQFNQKYIIQALQSVASSTSLPESEDRASSDAGVRHDYNTINLYTEQENCQQLLQQHFLCQSDTRALPFLIQANLMRQPERQNLFLEVDIDQQVTTKSISYEPVSEDTQLNREVDLDGNEEPTVILSYDRQKGRNKHNANNKTQTIHGENNYFDSAAATETIELSFDREAIEAEHYRREKTCTSKNGTHTCKPSQPNINYNDRQFNKVKDQPSHNNRQQARRPFTALKTTIKNTNETYKVNKLDRDELNKLKEKGLAEEKKLTNRKNKTKRDQALTLNKNESTTTLQTKNYSNKISSSKTKVMKKKPNQEHSNAESAVNKMASNSKVWLKSTDKSVRKLNRVNIGKIQVTFKKDKQIPKCVSSVPHKSDKYQSTYAQNDSKSILNSRFVHSSVKKFESKPNLMVKSKQADASSHINKPTPKQTQINANQRFEIEMGREERIGLVEKLDFESKTPIMHRIIEAKSIFKIYNQMANGYVEAARRINTKELKALEAEIKTISEEAIIKMKIIIAIVAFFSQFFKPAKKNVMGLIARYHEKQQNLQLYSAWRDTEQDIKNRPLKMNYESSGPNTSLDTLVLSLLEKPRDLVTRIQTLPSHLYNCNILSEHSVNSLLIFYEEINEKIDREGDLQLFLLKKTKLFNFLHRLVEFIRFLQTEGLIEKTQRRNLNISKNMMMGYYSSRSRREERGKIDANIEKLKIKKGCDSERKMTIDGVETDRLYDIEKKIREANAERNNKELVKGRKDAKPKSMQKQSKMSLSREHQIK